MLLKVILFGLHRNNLPCVFIVLINLYLPAVRHVTVVTPHRKHWRVGTGAGWRAERRQVTLTDPPNYPIQLTFNTTILTHFLQDKFYVKKYS